MPTASQYSGSDALIAFRTAYLRAVARIWRDPDANTPEVKALLTPLEGLIALRNQFGLDLGWNLQVTFSRDKNNRLEKQPVWKPRVFGGWVGGTEQHVLDVFLPTAPSDVSARAEALAAYYDLNPSVFSNRSGGSTSPGIEAALPEKLGSWSSFEESGAVLCRALAASWQDAEFQKALFLRKGDNSEAALERWLGYVTPWNMRLKLHECGETSGPYRMKWANGSWQWQEGNQPSSSPWHPGLPPARLVLQVPNEPDNDQGRDVTIQPIALASYNQTGERHPLTCCC